MSYLFDLVDALVLASDRDPAAARQLAEAALAASTITSTEEYHLLDLPIAACSGEVQDRTLGVYLKDHPPAHDEVFFWVHARDVPALIAGKDISGDGWRLAPPA